MADTNMGVGNGKKKHFVNTDSLHDTLSKRNGNDDNAGDRTSSGKCRATREYCEQLQAWMWQYYTGYVNWQSWLAATALPCPYDLPSASGTSTTTPYMNSQNWFVGPVGQTLLPYPPPVTSQSSRAGEAGVSVPPQQQVPQENGNAQRAGACQTGIALCSSCQPESLWALKFYL